MNIKTADLPEEWLTGYRDGYNDVARKDNASHDYRRGYSRGFSDAVDDCKIIIKPRIKSVIE